MKIQFSIQIEIVNGKDIELVGGLTIVLGGGYNVHDINHISSIWSLWGRRTPPFRVCPYFPLTITDDGIIRRKLY